MEGALSCLVFLSTPLSPLACDPLMSTAPLALPLLLCSVEEEEGRGGSVWSCDDAILTLGLTLEERWVSISDTVTQYCTHVCVGKVDFLPTTLHDPL